jgi:hypothetical protein
VQIRASEYTVRVRVFAVIVCTWAAWATPSPAQLRFSGPSNQLSVGSDGELMESTVSTAQFQPLVPADGTFAPAPPAASSEGLIDGDLPPAPPSVAQPEVIQPGIAQPMPAPVELQGASEWIEYPGDGAMIMPGPGLGNPYAAEIMPQQEPILYSTNDWFRTGFWYSQQDLSVMLRTATSNIVISADNSSPQRATILTTKTVDPTYVPGTRLTLGRFLGQDLANRDHAIEFTFLGLFSYSDSATLIARVPNALATALVPGAVYISGPATGIGTDAGIVNGPSLDGFSDANRHDVLYESDMNSFETNFRLMGRPNRDKLALQPNGSWVRHGNSSHIKSMLVGVRGVSINELFRFNSSFADPTTLGTHEVKTSNNMFGVQVGGEIVENYTQWSWGFRVKAGGLFNFSDGYRKIDQLVEGDRNLRESEVSDENLAALVEAGLVATYQIRTNLTARLAYDAMYITGIATAPQNLGLDPAFPKYEVTGDALFHGLSLGVEMLW